MTDTQMCLIAIVPLAIAAFYQTMLLLKKEEQIEELVLENNNLKRQLRQSENQRIKTQEKRTEMLGVLFPNNKNFPRNNPGVA